MLVEPDSTCGALVKERRQKKSQSIALNCLRGFRAAESTVSTVDVTSVLLFEIGLKMFTTSENVLQTSLIASFKCF